jgi:hypothetical protein
VKFDSILALLFVLLSHARPPGIFLHSFLYVSVCEGTQKGTILQNGFVVSFSVLDAH